MDIQTRVEKRVVFSENRSEIGHSWNKVDSTKNTCDFHGFHEVHRVWFGVDHFESREIQRQRFQFRKTVLVNSQKGQFRKLQFQAQQRFERILSEFQML